MKDEKEKELEYIKPDYEALANEEYAEEDPVGLEDLVYNEVTGEWDYENEDTFRMDRLQAEFDAQKVNQSKTDRS
jgi:hypothetical protein